MQILLTPGQMYALEQAHFAAGASSLALMERAAEEATLALAQKLSGLEGRRVYVACGGGNNGGDGLAMARLAMAAGARVLALPFVDEDSLPPDARANCQRARAQGVPFAAPSELASLPRPEAWVDALFGIGLNRPISGPCAEAIRRMNGDRLAGAFVLSVDMPSGVSASSGRALGDAVRADATVTFQYAKVGQFLLDGPDCTGELIVRGIGLRAPDFETPLLVAPADAGRALPARRRNSHKGTYGHLLVVAGSLGMAGAAAFAATAALRAGCGLVSIACPASIVPILQAIAPAAMCLPMPETDGALDARAAEQIERALAGKDALVAGPGLSQRAAPQTLRVALASHLPAVLDADALRLIARDESLARLLGPRHVITPHPGEAAQLLGRAPGDPLEDARALAALGPVALFKGNTTLVCGRGMHLSASGTPGMATAGSGDALAGIIGALLAAGVEPEVAAWAGSELHGLAGEAAGRAVTDVCLTAPDIIAHLPEAVRAARGY